MYDVKVYSIKAEGSRQITDHFRVYEFACSDGSDVVFVSQSLADIPYNTDDCCIYPAEDETIHVYRSGQDGNVWPPRTLNVQWTDLGPVGGPYIEEDA